MGCRRCFKLLIVVLAWCMAVPLSAQEWQSALLKTDQQGNLTYYPDDNGFTLPDFSTVGYRGGSAEIPDVPVKKTISPVAGDNTAHIQNAINELGALPLQKGMRGTLLLTAGQYDVYGTLYVPFDGVVIRGSGNGNNPASSTIIYGRGNSPANRTLIQLGSATSSSANRWNTSITQKTNIVDDIVKVSSKSFAVQSVSGYAVGDQIIIRQPVKQAWIDALEGGISGSACTPWQTSYELEVVFNRYITEINVASNTIHIDAPVYCDLRKSLSQSYIHKFAVSGICKEIGIENMRISIEHDPSVTATDNQIGSYKADENHAWQGIMFSSVENGWAKNVTVEHYASNAFNLYYSTRITIDNCQAIDPVSVLEGSKRYGFCMSQGAQQILVRDCYGRNGRHHYLSNGASKASGLVFLNCVSDSAFACSEGHRYWTTGMLFDGFKEQNYVYPNDDFTLGLYNRGCYGTAHGWSTAHSILWNCDVRSQGKGHIVLQKPPTAQNYAIGCFAKRIDNNGPFSGNSGYVEGSNSAGLVPASLYEAQRRAKFGTTHLSTNTLQSLSSINMFLSDDKILTIKSDYSDSFDINIYAVDGKLLYTTSESGLQIELPLKQITSGIYMIHVRSVNNNGFAVKKIYI